MAEWKRSTFDLPDDHGWTARPGNSIFVANRGAVLFEYPSHWVLKPDGNSICLYDREAPNDNMRLQVSVIRLGPDRSIVDWSTMPTLASLMEDAVLADDPRQCTRKGPLVGASRGRFLTARVGIAQLAKTSSSLICSPSSSAVRRVSPRPRFSAASNLPSPWRWTATVSAIGSTIQYSSTPCLPYTSCL